MNDFARDGAQLFDKALTPCMERLEAVLSGLPTDQAGTRLRGIEGLQPLLIGDGCVGTVAARLLGPSARPVRAILFNKTPETNWSLGWHQDRTICVKQRQDVDGYARWTVKRGMVHVEPPFALLSRMITLRVHLDDVLADNAPLLIAPGSHQLGRIFESEIEAVVRRCGTKECLAKTDDVWAYATPILHSSEPARRKASRRVLQVDYAAEELPGGLEWFDA